MNLKNIVLYRPSADNSGTFHDAGASLAVGDAADQPGTISSTRAAELIDSGGAASATAAAAADNRPAASEPAKD